MDSLCSSSSSSSSSSYQYTSTSAPVIRCGHIIPSIRLTPPDSRPAMAPEVPDQDLEPNHLFVPLRTEEVGWEEGGLIWAAKRYCYPTVNLYGGPDDHIIGTYRGGPKGYRFIKITDEAFSLASEDEDDISKKPAKTSKDGRKTSMPNGPATKASLPIETLPVCKDEDELITDSDSASISSSTPTSTPASSRRGSSSTEGDDDDSSCGARTPSEDADELMANGKGEVKANVASILDSALLALQHQEQDENRDDHKRTKMATRIGSSIEISNEPINAARLAGPMKSQLTNNALGLDRSLQLSDHVPSLHFTDARGRSYSRRSESIDFNAGWSYEENMRQEYLQRDQYQL